MIFRWRRFKTQPAASSGADLRCSFCNKSQLDVRKLIAGPKVYICSECVEVCNDIIAEEAGIPTARDLEALADAKNYVAPVSCGLCKSEIQIELAVKIEDREWRGWLCKRCVDAVLRA